MIKENIRRLFFVGLSGLSALTHAAPFNYESIPAPAVSIPDNGCPTVTSTTINVTDNFTINDLNIGLNITHTYRGDLIATIVSPDSTTVQLFNQNAGAGNDNLDVLLDSGSSNSLDDGNADDVSSPFYDRTATPPSGSLNDFNGENAQGVWTFTICDSANVDTGTVNRISLQFDGTAVGGGGGSLTPGSCNAAGVTAAWQMDNDTNDSVGANNSSAGSVTFSTVDPLFGSHSASFNGSSNSLTYSVNGGFMEQAADNISVSMFIKPASLSGNQMLYEEGGATNGLALRLNGSNLEAAVREGGAGSQQTLSTSFPSDGEWHQVGVVYESGVMTLYLDGVASGTVSTGFGQLAGHGDNGGLGGLIGGSSAFGGGAAFYNGLMDEVTYYTSALDASQMSTISSCAGTSTTTLLAPTIAKSFSPSSIVSGSTSTLTFTLNNTNASALTGLSFTDNMPAAITLSNATIGGTCSGVTIDAGTTAGSNNIGITGGAIPASGNCTIEFTVTSSTVANHDNTTSVVSTNEAPNSAVSNTATLSVTSTPPTGGSQGCGLLTVNESFELPDILNTPPTPNQVFNTNVKNYNQGDVPGWSTTSVGQPYIELWHNNANASIPAPNGDQYAELNANEAAALYQDVSTVPGQRIRYTFKHRGRNGTDTMRFMAGAPGSAVQVGPNYSTSNTAWATYTGTYTVPSGQTTTRFQYEAVGGGSNGNFLDDIQFVVECDFGDAPDTYSTLEGSNGARHTVTPNLYFGAAPPDDDFPLYANGTGFVGNGQDDDNSGVDDEVTTLPTSYDKVKNYTIPVTVTNITGSTANVYAWLDFDRNGVFDADEAANTTVATGVTNGTVNLSWSNLGDGGADVNVGDSYLRLRISTNAMNANSAIGPLNDGEVEDHPITIQNGLAADITKSFSPSAIQAGDTTTMTLTVINPYDFPQTAVTFSDNMPKSMWLDSLTVGGTCTGFSLTTGALGDSNFVLSGGNVPANSSCTVELTVMSSVSGTHSNTTSGYESNELVEGNPSNEAQLTVTDASNAVCTPGSLSSGAIFASFGTGIYAINLQTGKAKLVTTRTFTINSLSVNPEKYLVYYADNNTAATNRSLFFYDLLSGTHSTLVADINTLGITTGTSGIGGAGSGYRNGSIYQGIEDTDQAWRIVLSDDGRSARYATLLFSMATNHDFGDFVVSGDKLYDFDRTQGGGGDTFRRYSLVDFTIEQTTSVDIAQGGAQRDGNTLWSVDSNIQIITTNGVLQGTPIPVTTDGSTSLGGAADAANCVVTTSRIGDLIWNDEDGDGVKDANEQGIANVTLNLHYDLNADGVIDAADIVAATTTTAADGSYSFDNLTPDDYIVTVTDTNNVLGSATPTNGALPRQVSNLGFNEDRDTVDFGYQSFIVIRGSVFEDNGLTGGTANNGVRDGAELGFENILVELRDPANSNALVSSALTDGNGNYTLTAPNSFAGTTLDVIAKTSNGYVSIGENVGSTGSSNANTRDDKITLSPTSGTVYTNVDFGDVNINTFTPDNTGTVQAAQIRFYSHEFTAGTAGEVTFSETDIQTPSGLNWQNIIYRDTDCSGELNSVEASAAISGSITVTANEKICIINKVFAPSNAPVNAQFINEITADFIYTGETPDGLTAQQTVTDVTTLAVAGLVLDKKVQNITTSGALGTSNTALPGHQLRYTVNFANNSAGSISDLVIRDTVPAYTSLQAPATCPGALPNNLTTCAVVTPITANNVIGYQGAIEWSFTGNLAAGQQGTVTFDVTVE